MSVDQLIVLSNVFGISILSKSIQRQVSRSDFVTVLLSHPGLVISNDLVRKYFDRRSAGWRQRIENTIALAPI